jgi:hypothetical protein
MLSRTVGVRSATRAWFNLGEFATNEADLAAYRDARAVDTKISGISSKYATPPPTIDWSQWEDKIAHKDIVQGLKAFHQQQMKSLKDLMTQDHKQSVASQVQGWELYESAINSCSKSVEASEEILRNGARALYISFNNPPSRNATQSEWLDTDQYWQAFVEKHMYHANYLNINEDPESKEAQAAHEAALLKQWQIFDGRGVARFNNKLLYQRPSYEYYDLYRGPLVEHMIYYLAKTGGDSRFFPELPPYQWFSEIYSNRFDVFEVLQRRRRHFQETAMARELPLEMTPHDMEADGEHYYEDWVARESALMELQVARLMGNYIFLSDAVPIQTESALLRAIRADSGAGKFYSLGEDVSAVFYKPAGSKVDDEVAPTEALHSLISHMRLTGKAYLPGYNQLLTVLHRTFESRKEGLNGRWFKAPGESQASAFMRRLKTDDPSRAVYEAYVAELDARWATATEVPHDRVLQMVKTKQSKYLAECAEFETLATALCENLSASVKEATAHLDKTANLSGLLSDGTLIAVNADAKAVHAAEAVGAAIKNFELEKDRFTELVLSQKVPALDGPKKK